MREGERVNSLKVLYAFTVFETFRKGSSSSVTNVVLIKAVPVWRKSFNNTYNHAIAIMAHSKY